MRRVIMTIGGTVAAVAALLSFKTHPAAGVSAAGTASSPGASPAATAAANGGGTANGGGAAKGGAKSASGRLVTGKTASTPYGPVQVQLVLAGKRITKVNVLQQTDTGAMSAQIDSFAVPKLTSETLTAQSARIDAVSGATYTSQGYLQSLQSAVDAARL